MSTDWQAEDGELRKGGFESLTAHPKDQVQSRRTATRAADHTGMSAGETPLSVISRYYEVWSASDAAAIRALGV